jgi:thioredoxin 1
LVDTSLNTIEDVTSTDVLRDNIAVGVSVVFFHVSWCHVCEEQRPFVESAAEHVDSKSVNYFEIDHVENKQLFKDYDVDGFPQILFFKDGEEQERLTGKGHSADKIIEIAKNYL